MCRVLPPVGWTLLGAGAMTTLGTLPIFLLSSQSVFIRDELGFDAAHFGAAVSVFFGSAAAAALLGGPFVDRWGRRRSTVVAGLVAAVGCLGVAWPTRSWGSLVAMLALLGVANAACQVTANLSLAQVVPPHRRGLGFGVKQSAVPLSIMLAGLAVPTVGTLVGWRGTFALNGIAALVIAGAGLRLPREARGRRDSPVDVDRPPVGALAITMVAIALASGAANSLGSFIASWGFRVGLSPGEAGMLMAAGSALNIVLRVSMGHLADRRHGRNLPVVAMQMSAGAVGLAVLSVPSPYSVVPAALVAFGLGWSWPGLLLYAVVRIGRDAPAAASGILQAGAFVGGAAGPAMFGATVAAVGYEAAWLAGALCFATAALLVILARRVFIADLEARPPTRPIRYGGGRRAPARSTRAPRPRSDSDEADDPPTGDRKR